ncbi:hypothetical protein ACFSM5_13940 [Lacibacterium aquatile]|uniref:Uncharacterized protein n=1 Tax=Lacibacterium aquatile TaxID=1168082 RepID=A0ABW5DS65_9PROT
MLRHLLTWIGMILLITALFFLLRDAFQSIHQQHVHFSSLRDVWLQMHSASLEQTLGAMTRSGKPVLTGILNFLLAVPACAVATLFGGLCWILSASLPRRV